MKFNLQFTSFPSFNSSNSFNNNITILSLMLSGGLCVAIGYTLCSLLTFSNSSNSSHSNSSNLVEDNNDKKNKKNESEEIKPLLKRSDSFVWASGRPILRVVITGVAAALPGESTSTLLSSSNPSSNLNSNVNNIHRIIDGECFIEQIPDDVKESMLEKNVFITNKNKQRVKIEKSEDNISIRSCISESFDLSLYGVPESICNTMDRAVQVSVACGLEALRDAGIVTGQGEGLSGWVLPEHLQPTTGVVYATSFPALDTAISEVTKFFRLQSKQQQKQSIPFLINSLKLKLQSQLDSNNLPNELEESLQNLSNLINSINNEEIKTKTKEEEEEEIYEFDRKFLFRVLVLGNAQLAQIVKARGPNMQTNAACAGSTQAIALAHDMIQLGRAERMIVIAGDNASSDTLMPWLGNGFRALGAATICSNITDAACPFDIRRSGMILGAGGIGMILESENGARRRYEMTKKYHPLNNIRYNTPFKCRLLGSLYSNSAYHGASLDKEHIANEMERFISTIESEYHITRSDIAKYGVYFSHETSTNSSPNSSCANNELYALKKVFQDSFSELLILNTKGFTGHPMGVSFEDVVAVEVLYTKRVPKIANLQNIDPFLGSNINLSKGGVYPCRYAIRFAAGFGSQIALAIYGSIDT